MSVLRLRTGGLCEHAQPDADSEARAWQQRAAEFAEEIVRPLGLAVDRLDGARASVVGSLVREFLAQAEAEGFTRLSDARRLGGAGLHRITEYLVLEELAAADAGLAALLIAASLPSRFAPSSGAGGCLFTPASAGRVRARVDGRGWRLSGSGHAEIIGGAVASHVLIACGAADCSDGALVILPLDREGVRRRVAERRVGLRAAACAALEFTDVCVRHDELMRGPQVVGGAIALDHLMVASLSVGIARCAYDGAARWMAEHGGASPRRIVLLCAMLERARELTRSTHVEVCDRLEAGRPVSAERAAHARMLAARTAAELAHQAMSITAPGGFAPDGVEYLDGSRFHPEKLARDAHEHSILRRAPTPARRATQPRAHRSATWGL